MKNRIQRVAAMAGLAFVFNVLVASSAALAVIGKAVEASLNLHPAALRCEYLENPLGIDAARPRFSWELKSQERGQKQSACRILVASSPEALAAGKDCLWDSGRVKSGQSVLVPYAGQTLKPDTDCYWKVMVWDKDGKPSAWSEVARFSIGLLAEDDWKGEWIEFPAGDPKTSCPQYRKTFTLERPASRAFVYVASLGTHELHINGRKADDRVLAPAHSFLAKRVLYVAYDVADLLQRGENVIAVWHGPGFAPHDGARPAIRVQANIVADGGSAVSIGSDASWKCAESGHRIFFRKEEQRRRYGGEEIDARKLIPNWNTVAFDDSAWAHAKPTPRNIVVSAQTIEPDRIIKTFPPVSVTEAGDKFYKVDFGTNFTGFVELRNLRGEPGQEILIQSADDPISEQDFDQASRYICGNSPGTFRHRFNWAAGRFVRITGLDYRPQPGDILGHAVSTDLERTGRFECSNDLLNRIYETDLWTFRANTVHGFTMDCPHRERRGYGEVAWANAWGIGLPNYHTGAFYAHTVRNWCDSQWDNGFIPHISPNSGVHGGGLLWSSAPLNVGWDMFRHHGDEGVVAQAYPFYRKWLEFLHANASRSEDGIITQDIYESKSRASKWYFLGDWLAPGDRREWRDSPEAALFNNCTYALNLKMMIDIAAALNRDKDVSFYSSRLARLREAIHAKFFNAEKNTHLDTKRQVHLAFPLLTRVVPEELKPAVLANLKSEMTGTAPYLDAGSSGLPVLLHYLIEDAEWNDVLYGAIHKTTYPGYGFFLDRGETTWPESWRTESPAIRTPSKIHTCFTGIASWFIKGIGGIRTAPGRYGYQSFIIKPHLVGDLGYADTNMTSPYGLIVSNWKRTDDGVRLHVEIPPNTTATVYVPGRNIENVTESGGSARQAEGVRFIGAENDRLVFEVGSGTYEFVSSIPNDPAKMPVAPSPAFTADATVDELEQRFLNPCIEDRLGVYWFWSNATDEGAITRDLEAMAHVGIGRAILSMTQDHSATRKDGTGTVFLSARFLELFRFALDEAARLGIRITAIPSNGWYQGGPWVTPEMGPQMLVWSRIECSGPNSKGLTLPVPDHHRTGRGARIARGAIDHLKPVAVMAFQKDTNGRLLAGSKVDLSSKISASGELGWAVPTGNWVIYRFGHVPSMARMKQDSPGYGGLQIDHMSRAAMERHLQEVAVPMLKAAGPHVGNTLDRLHQDSMEIGFYDWTPLLPEQFQQRCGYDLVPLLPLFAGESFLEGAPADRVERDFTELLDELLIEEHYGTFREFCHHNGLTLVAESGETGSGIKMKGAPVDHVMDEFWTHFGLGMDSITFNRNAAFAAQVYGQNRYTCEAFTSHQQWMETPAQLKDLANGVYARGVNHLTIHGFSSSTATTPPPGDVYFAGTHFNPGVTWWKGYARPLTAFFNRCQSMLAAGLPVVDMLYIDGPALQEMIKTNEMLWESDRRFWKFAGIPCELLAEKAAVNGDGRIILPSGQTYAVLVVADRAINLAAMRAVTRLAEQGAIVWFQAVPEHSPRLSDGPDADSEIQTLVKSLGADRAPGIYQAGKGRIMTGADHDGMHKIGPGVRARTFYDGMHATAMDRLGIPPAFSYQVDNPDGRIYFLQRNAPGADMYFLANARRADVRAECAFRVSGRQPERWDPLSGKISDIQTFSVAGENTVVPLEFASHESFFVVFRKHAEEPVKTKPAAAGRDVLVGGPWTISFDPAREGLESFTVESDSLFRWDTATDRRIADFSGTAVYRTTVEIPEKAAKSAKQIMLDLGQSPGLYKLTGMGAGRPYGIDPDFYDALCAEVIINNNRVGVLWCSPYRMDISSLIRADSSELEIRVTNTWHNWRLANKFTAGTHPWEKKGLELPPAPSGLLGPVQLKIMYE